MFPINVSVVVVTVLPLVQYGQDAAYVAIDANATTNATTITIAIICLDRFFIILLPFFATLEQQDQHSLLVQHYKNFSRVLYQNIIYVRKTARSVQIITSNQGVIKDNRGIKELFGILNDPRFIFVDRSYFVNLDYAKELCGDSIIMLNGEALPVSRPMMPKVKEAILSLWGDGLVK